MALCSLLQAQTSKCLLVNVGFFLLLFTKTTSLSFNFTKFSSNMKNVNISLEEDATASGDVLQLTTIQGFPVSGYWSVGRASYAKEVRLYDKKSGRLTDFTTRFTFNITSVTINCDGIAFFLAPFESKIPPRSRAGCLGLVDNNTKFDVTANDIVAVEFDGYSNEWDPKLFMEEQDHVGININSINSTKFTVVPKFRDGKLVHASVSYDSSTQNLSVSFTYGNNSVLDGGYSLSHIVDLRDLLSERVRVGFSAASGECYGINSINSWSFNSTLEVDEGNEASKVGLIVGLCGGFAALMCVSGVLWLVFWTKRATRRKEEEAYDQSIDDEFDKEAGPKRFIYRELNYATNSFAEDRKLGEGGFGGVYKGMFSESNTLVAVKRISRGSKQGKKEYVSEVKIISRLRHRNLVQLIGWCHEKGEFLLVYELMPNGSLDSHLFGEKATLLWPVRQNIALGLASALLYLHEEGQQRVVHRDIKSSNVMLDSNFNAKLGDFGLARLVDDEFGLRTTILAGTRGYLAPECIITGKAGKESDVYSFGVVALEICCGRRSIQRNAEPDQESLVEWVWDLYGKGQVLEAADKKLNKDFDEQQMECLMIVGLWCCHPDPSFRPPIKQVVRVLDFEAPLPDIPSSLPKPMYFPAPSNVSSLSYASSVTTIEGR